jgi:hypothetical protein
MTTALLMEANPKTGKFYNLQSNRLSYWWIIKCVHSVHTFPAWIRHTQFPVYLTDWILLLCTVLSLHLAVCMQFPVYLTGWNLLLCTLLSLHLAVHLNSKLA